MLVSTKSSRALPFWRKAWRQPGRAHRRGAVTLLPINAIAELYSSIMAIAWPLAHQMPTVLRTQ